jgi:predicted nucleic acid-binding protein
MNVDVFLDTNVLLYAASASLAEADKRAIARKIMHSENFGISTQVLQEFFVNAVRKAHIKMSPASAQTWMAELDTFPCLIVDRDLIKLAIAKSIRFKIGYFDAAILAAAEAMGASTVYTEDLNHGQNYGPVRVINPFRPA